MSQIVVFIDGTADYLDVHEMTESVIRGRVINGHWELYIDRVNRMAFIDQSPETDGSVLEPLHSYTSLEIEVGHPGLGPSSAGHADAME